MMERNETNNTGSWSRAKQVWSMAAREIVNLEAQVDEPAFLRTVELLSNCSGKVILFGAGTSAMAARKIAHTLSCVERPALFLSPTDAVHGGLGVVQPGDIAILVSKGGNTSELVALVPALRKKTVPIIAVTENGDSVLANKSSVLLRICVEQEADKLNMLATTSTLAVIALFDAICISVMERTGFSAEQFAVIHPGGAVGERLHGDS